MQRETWLDGRVWKETLPASSIPGELPAAMPKRLRLAQGDLTQVYNAREGIRYLAGIDLTVGGVRGNHYHRHKREWVYLFKGELRLIVADLELKRREEFLAREGDLVFLDVLVVHAFVPLTPGFALEFSPVEFDPKDVVKVALA